MKDARRIVQTFPLFSVVSDCIKQVSRTYYDRSFRVIYTSRQLVQIRLANRSLVQIFPRLGFQPSANGSTHKLIPHNTNASTLVASPPFRTQPWRLKFRQLLTVRYTQSDRRVNCQNTVQTLRGILKAVFLTKRP